MCLSYTRCEHRDTRGGAVTAGRPIPTFVFFYLRLDRAGYVDSSDNDLRLIASDQATNPWGSANTPGRWGRLDSMRCSPLIDSAIHNNGSASQQKAVCEQIATGGAAF